MPAASTEKAFAFSLLKQEDESYLVTCCLFKQRLIHPNRSHRKAFDFIGKRAPWEERAAWVRLPPTRSMRSGPASLHLAGEGNRDGGKHQHHADHCKRVAEAHHQRLAFHRVA